MYRNAIKGLEKWSVSKNRKPLIIRGARQVGKTWLMKEFGTKNYQQLVYVNFESSKALRNLFQDDFDVNRILSALQIETGKTIEASSTLIILDEIQEAEGGITALKYFRENAPEYHVIAAGSLLGVLLHQQMSFPVGKVDFLDLYPLNFSEYLLAIGQTQLQQIIEKQDWQLLTQFKSKLILFLKQYYFVGGMPEAVVQHVETNDYSLVRQVQSNILKAYEQDFSKHAPVDIVPRIRMLWNSIPSQLAKENKKFIYSALKKGARAKDYELALAWLSDSGLVHRVPRITKPGIPLKAYEDFGVFKLYALDTGLLAAMGGINERTIITGNVIFEEFKGALTEQFVLQQLVSSTMDVYYWSANNAMAEVDFVVQVNGQIHPIEVKAEENLKAKSLKAFNQRYPETKAIRTSMSDYREESWLINLPLYAINSIGH